MMEIDSEEKTTEKLNHQLGRNEKRVAEGKLRGAFQRFYLQTIALCYAATRFGSEEKNEMKLRH